MIIFLNFFHIARARVRVRVRSLCSYLYPWQTDGDSQSLSWVSTSGQSCPPLAGDCMIIRFLECFFLVLPPKQTHKKTHMYMHCYESEINWQLSINVKKINLADGWWLWFKHDLKKHLKKRCLLCAHGCILLNLSM